MPMQDNMDASNANHGFAEYLFSCVMFPLLVIGMKRAREEFEELAAGWRVRRIIGRKRNIHRNRADVLRELHQLDTDTFQRMFRMPYKSFCQLDASVTQVLLRTRRWTAQSAKMARVSSGSVVNPTLLFASTIR